jgi:prepilin-type processing-associated H-X9-DG protein
MAGGTGGAPSAFCLQETDDPFGGGTSPAAYPKCDWHIADPLLAWQNFDGVSGWRIGAKISQIIDGASKTALVGEKMMEPRFYDGTCEETGDNPSKGNGGDNNSMFQGYDYDNTRWGYPNPDEDGVGNSHSRFGSAHPGGFHLAMCDGSVQTIDYDIDERVWGDYVKRNNKDYLTPEDDNIDEE